MDSSPARGWDWEAAFRQRSTVTIRPWRIAAPLAPTAVGNDDGPGPQALPRPRVPEAASAKRPATPGRRQAFCPASYPRCPVQDDQRVSGNTRRADGTDRGVTLRKESWRARRRSGTAAPALCVTPRQRCRQVLAGGRGCDARTLRATVRCVVEARTLARAGGTDLPVRLPPPASAGRSRWGTCTGRASAGRTSRRPGACSRALVERGTLDEGAAPGVAEPPAGCERPHGAPWRSTRPANPQAGRGRRGHPVGTSVPGGGRPCGRAVRRRWMAQTTPTMSPEESRRRRANSRWR